MGAIIAALKSGANSDAARIYGVGVDALIGMRGEDAFSVDWGTLDREALRNQFAASGHFSALCIHRGRFGPGLWVVWSLSRLTLPPVLFLADVDLKRSRYMPNIIVMGRRKKIALVGASGYVLKGCTREELLAAIRTAAAGESAWTREELRRVTGALATPRLSADVEVPLTQRESEVLRQELPSPHEQDVTRGRVQGLPGGRHPLRQADACHQHGNGGETSSDGAFLRLVRVAKAAQKAAWRILYRFCQRALGPPCRGRYVGRAEIAGSLESRNHRS